MHLRTLVAASFFFVLAACGGAIGTSVKPGPMPQGGSFSGVWFSPQYGEMHLLQQGATVVGRYEKEERKGRIQGSADGDLMRFEWTEQREMIPGRPTTTKGHGYFRIVKDEAEDAWKILGEWGVDDDETGGGPWNAVKSKRRRPDVDGRGSSASESRSSGDESSYDGDEQDDSGSSDSEEGDEDLSDL